MQMSSLILIISILIGIFQDCRAVCGGKRAVAGQFKYIVAIENTATRELCGGAIIDEKHILTAAHCVHEAEPDNLLITAGTINIYDGSGEKRLVKRKHVYSDYQHPVAVPIDRQGVMKLFQCIIGPSTINTLPEHDIAVLTLHESLVFGDFIDKVKLPESNELPLCTPCAFAGWGVISPEANKLPRVLRWNTIMILSAEENRNNSNYVSNEFLAIDNKFCTCPLKGDSGGPLVCNGIAVGVISHGQRGPNTPTAFTKIHNYLRFIDLVKTKDSLLP